MSLGEYVVTAGYQKKEASVDSIICIAPIKFLYGKAVHDTWGHGYVNQCNPVIRLLATNNPDIIVQP